MAVATTEPTAVGGMLALVGRGRLQRGFDAASAGQPEAPLGMSGTSGFSTVTVP